MNPAIAVPFMFFIVVIVLGLGLPLVRTWSRRQEQLSATPAGLPDIAARLDRIEAIVESVAIEVERLSEGQRFTTRLLSEAAPLARENGAREPAAARSMSNEVRDA
ncbi:MAG TPA: hypothetical protein VE861_02440 [Gemmatimonadaceae bacterium]|nr:hypothetical protein [Gemmatimonadaceae bacterium]